MNFGLVSKTVEVKKTPTVLVPEAGLEPARYRYQRILSPPRLPIPTYRQDNIFILSHNVLFVNLIFEKIRSGYCK